MKRQARKEVKLTKENKDYVLIKDGKDSRNRYNQSYSIESGHVIHLNVVLRKEIRHFKRKIWSVSVKVVSHDS